MNSQAKEIKIGEHISYDLASRASASDLIDQINNMAEDHIIVDFRGVRSITRSFAHEYITKKAASKKNIEDVSVPENVRKMFIAVNSSGQKARIFDPSKVKVFPL